MPEARRGDGQAEGCGNKTIDELVQGYIPMPFQRRAHQQVAEITVDGGCLLVVQSRAVPGTCRFPQASATHDWTRCNKIAIKFAMGF